MGTWSPISMVHFGNNLQLSTGELIGLIFELILDVGRMLQTFICYYCRCNYEMIVWMFFRREEI